MQITSLVLCYHGTMYVMKCDICKKKLKDDPIRAGFGYFVGNDFCSKCGKPLIDFLKKHKFINKEKE